MREIRKNDANRRFIKVSLDSSELNVAPNFLAPDAAYFSPLVKGRLPSSFSRSL
ncbi:hypothetical protein LINPERHAP1_LOCUS31207, partial [Linum perenne]